MNKLKKLINERKAFLDQMNAVIKDAEKEDRDLSEDESAKIDKIEKDIQALDKKIDSEKNRMKLQEQQNDLNTFMDGSDSPRFSPVLDPDMSESREREDRELARYSFIKAFRNQLEGRLEGFELEMHQEASIEARNYNHALEGLGIPQVILARSRGQPRNDLTATGGSGGDEGGVTIRTELRSVIDILREALMVRAMGATVLTDLVGNIDFPKAITDSDPTEKTETGAADENSPTFGSVSLRPKRLPVVAEVTRQLLIQSSMDIEQWLRRYLAFRIASRMDKMAINGSGSSNQPTGILNASGIAVVPINTNGGPITRTHLVSAVGEVAVDNADMGRLGFLTNPKVRATLQDTKVDAGSGQFIWKESAQELLGYRALVSTNVPSNLTKGTGDDLSALIYGNWESLMIGQWGGLDTLLNPFTKDSQGIVRVNMSTFYDTAIEHEESFSAVVDATTII